MQLFVKQNIYSIQETDEICIFQIYVFCPDPNPENIP